MFNPRRPRGPLLREMLRRSIDWQHRLLCGELVELRKRDLIGRIA